MGLICRLNFYLRNSIPRASRKPAIQLLEYIRTEILDADTRTAP